MAAAYFWDFILSSPPACSLPYAYLGFPATLGASQVCFCLRALALAILSAWGDHFLDLSTVCSYSSFKSQLQYHLSKNHLETTASKFKMMSYSP